MNYVATNLLESYENEIRELSPYEKERAKKILSGTGMHYKEMLFENYKLRREVLNDIDFKIWLLTNDIYKICFNSEINHSQFSDYVKTKLNDIVLTINDKSKILNYLQKLILIIGTYKFESQIYLQYGNNNTFKIVDSNNIYSDYYCNNLNNTNSDRNIQDYINCKAYKKYEYEDLEDEKKRLDERKKKYELEKESYELLNSEDKLNEKVKQTEKEYQEKIKESKKEFINYKTVQDKQKETILENIKKLKEEVSELQDKKENPNEEECICCNDKRISIAFTPCGHYVTCKECSTKVDKCPCCKVKIKERIKIYKP